MTRRVISSRLSRTMSLLPEVNVTTVSGVDSIDSIRSQLTTIGWLLRRLSGIMTPSLPPAAPGPRSPRARARVPQGAPARDRDLQRTAPQQKSHVLVGCDAVAVVGPGRGEGVAGLLKTPQALERPGAIEPHRLNLRTRFEREVEPRQGQLVTAFFHQRRPDLGVRLPERHLVVDQGVPG